MAQLTNQSKRQDWLGLRFDAQAWRVIWQRFSFIMLIAVAAFFLLLAKADLRIITFAANHVQGVAAPIISFVQNPVAGLRGAADVVGEIIAVHERSNRLMAENLELRGWKAQAVHLDVQNKALREQLNFPKTEQTPQWITARVIGDSTTSYVHTRLLALGARQGLAVGMAAVDENGLVGRIIKVGASTSRLLLITDFSSKIPVVVASSNDRAILTGDNGPQPLLDFLPLDPSYRIGDLVMTSGDGGMLPAGIPVGVISATVDKKALVRPFADWSRLDFVTALLFEPLPAPEEAPAPSEPEPGAPLVSLDAQPLEAGAPQSGPAPIQPQEGPT